MQIHFTDAEVKRLVKRLKLPAGKSQADYFENIMLARSLILTLNAGGRHAWSVLFYEHGRPKRRKIGYYSHSDAKFPELTVKQARQAAIDFDVQDYLAQGKVGSFKAVARPGSSATSRAGSDPSVRSNVTSMCTSTPIGPIGRSSRSGEPMSTSCSIGSRTSVALDRPIVS